MENIKYYVYSIKYERLDENKKKVTITEDFYLREEERDYIFNNGSSKVYINFFPADQKSLFHAWNMPKNCIRSKHTYLCEEPSRERKDSKKLTAEDYKIIEV